jgi:hypothetical protein
MHFVVGAQATPHCMHRPSLALAHCLYERSAGSYMHESSGAHAEPKWKHAPAPLDRHVK